MQVQSSRRIVSIVIICDYSCGKGIMLGQVTYTTAVSEGEVNPAPYRSPMMKSV
jgi:hypothetical protein